MTRNRTKSIISFLPLFFIIAIIALHSYGRARNMLFGPEIKINYPSDGQVLFDDVLILSGEIKNAAFIRLNGRQIFVDSDKKGSFREKLLLHYGYNIIQIEAKDRFGQNEKKHLQVVYK